jgi:glycosyltransferase involved in cell wall biosynthesis
MSGEIKKPHVSVFVITYKHENYIAQCLDSLVSQITDFDFHIIIGEDCSPDNTGLICEQYANRYPEIITLLPNTENIGAVRNGIRTFRACTGKYIAMCEGDDYWCDNYKLQKQVDFLEANPDFSICFAEAEVLDEMGWNMPHNFYFPVLTKDVFTIEDFITSQQNIIPTASILFRNVLPDPYPDFFVNASVGDIPIQLFAGDKGKARRMNEHFSVYRNHAGGNTKSQEMQLKAEATLRKLYNAFNEYTGYKYNSAFRKRFFESAKNNLIFGSGTLKGISKFRNYLKWFPEYIKYSEKINFREVLYYHLILFAPGILKKLGSKNAGNTTV